MLSKLGTRAILKLLSPTSSVNIHVKLSLSPQINLLSEDSLVSGLFFSQVGMGLI